jgi:hypothetical protein
MERSVRRQRDFPDAAQVERRQAWSTPQLIALPALVDLTLTTSFDQGGENPGMFRFGAARVG